MIKHMIMGILMVILIPTVGMDTFTHR